MDTNNIRLMVILSSKQQNLQFYYQFINLFQMKQCGLQNEETNSDSSFMEQLQAATQELMEEVFAKPYYPQTRTTLKPPGNNSSFNEFMRRNAYYVSKNEKWVKEEQRKKESQEIINLQSIPKILRSSKEKLEPIYQRGLELDRKKQRKMHSLRIQQQQNAVKEIEEKCTFKPQIHAKGAVRTIEEYLRDKDEWLKDKNEKQQLLRIREQSKKFTQCTFKPQLVAKQIIREYQPVENRLLRSLQSSTMNSKDSKESKRTTKFNSIEQI